MTGPKATTTDELLATIRQVRAPDEDGQRERAAARKQARDLARRELEPRIQKRLLSAARAHQTPSALLLGPTGIGKTSAAKWMLAGAPYLMVRSVDLAVAQREHPLGAGPPELVARARGQGYVVLDDVGSEKDPQAIQELLDYRYARQLPTIATSGLTRQELVQHLGAAYVRRIIEQHAGHAVLVWDGFDA